MNQAVIRVLLVEDDSGDAVLVERALGNGRGQVELVVASTLSEAMDRLDRQSFDAILMDLSLPDSVGVEGVARIANQFPASAVVVLSGLSDNTVALESLEQGAQDYLVKGHLSGEQLERTLRHAIQRHQVQCDNRRLLAELERMAHCDSLTGLLNRHSLNTELEREWSRSERSGEPLACILLDADFFKRVNDSFGHAAGDEVLKGIAQLLKQSCRTTDHVARYGGEEFCVLLPGASEEQAVEWAERVRQQIAKRGFNFEGSPLRVTASFGVAQKSADTTGTGELLRFADEALLAAKQSGRNRVVACLQASSATLDHAHTNQAVNDALARDVMAPVVLQLGREQSLYQAVDMLVQTRLDSLPLVDPAGQLIGLLAEEDLTASLLSQSSSEISVEEVADRRTVSFSENTPIREIWAYLRRAAVRRVVIVDDRNRPSGTISRGTILRWLRNLSKADAESRMVWPTVEATAQFRTQHLSATLHQLVDQVERLREECRSESRDPTIAVINGVSQVQETLDQALAQASYRQEQAALATLSD